MSSLQEICIQCISRNSVSLSKRGISRNSFNKVVKTLVESKRMDETLMRFLTSTQSMCISLDFRSSYNIISNLSLQRVSGILGLVNLNLSGCTKFDGPSIRFLKELPLHSLDLSNTNVQDADLKELQGIPCLKVLQLSGDKITDTGMKYLAELSLESVTLSRTYITDEGIDDFATLAIKDSLQRLDIINTKVTDESSVALASFPNLVQLKLFKCAINIGNLKKILSKEPLNKTVKVSSMNEFEIIKHVPVVSQKPVTNNSDWCMDSLKKYVEEIPDFNERNKGKKGRLSCSLTFDSPLSISSTPKVEKKESPIAMSPLVTCRDSMSGKKSLSPVSSSFDYDEDDSLICKEPEESIPQVEIKLPEAPKEIPKDPMITQNVPKEDSVIPKAPTKVQSVPKEEQASPKKPQLVKEVPKVVPVAPRITQVSNDDPDFALVMMLIGESKGRRLRNLVEETTAEVINSRRESPDRTPSPISPIRTRPVAPIYIDLTDEIREEIVRDLKYSDPEKDCSVSSSPVQLLDDPLAELSPKSQKRKRGSQSPQSRTIQLIASPSKTPLKSTRAKEVPKAKRRSSAVKQLITPPAVRSSSRVKRQRLDCTLM